MTSGLQEADEPKPWEKLGLPVHRIAVGKHADQELMVIMGTGIDFSILVCDGCARWQQFDPGDFAETRRQATAAGWKRVDEKDWCRICGRN